jgi:hypothetical protein
MSGASSSKKKATVSEAGPSSSSGRATNMSKVPESYYKATHTIYKNMSEEEIERNRQLSSILTKFFNHLYNGNVSRDNNNIIDDNNMSEVARGKRKATSDDDCDFDFDDDITSDDSNSEND